MLYRRHALIIIIFITHSSICWNEGSGDFAVTTPTTVIAQGVAFSSKYDIPFSICSSDSHCDDKNDCTYDRCNTTNQLCFNEPMPCAECGKVLTVDIVTDEYPDESTWYLKNDLSTISFNDGPYEKDNTLYQREMCLPYGSYNFTMIDSYGDGFGFSSNDGDDANDGYYDDDWYNYDDDNATDSRRLQGINVTNKTKGYALILQNEVIKRGGDFHHTEETLFTICSKDKDCNDNNVCTDDSCNSTSNLCMFDPKPCHECGELLNLAILPDKWPQDITWTIQDIVTDETILSGGPYEQKDLQQTTECLEFGSYLFSIFDSYGDGLCCDEGSGYYQLSMGSKVVKRGGNYSAFEEKSFHVCSSDSDCAVDNSCITSTCDLNSNVCIEKKKSCSECGSKVSIEIRTDGYPSETYWAVANSRNEEVLSGGPYNISNGFNTQSRCLEFGSYNFSIFDYDGICCNGDDDGGDGNYTVKLNNKALRTGGEFERAEFIPFVICNIDAECNDQNECTEDVCDQEMRACVYNTKPCSECGVNVSVDVLTDDYPDEISWKILDEDTEQIIMIGGPYNENDTSKLFQHSSCLPYNNYLFVAYDEYGDGFGGEGYYKLKINDNVMKQSGSDYSVEEESFRICSSDIHCSNANSCLSSTCDKGTNTCVEHTSCSHCGANISVDILTDKRPIDTTWKIKSMNLNQTILAGGPYSLTDLYRTGTCLEFGDYLFTIYDKYGDGMCCDSGFGNYNLTIQDKVVFNGGHFGESDEVKFTVCSSDADCNDNDNCTSDRCSESNACVYEQKLCSECGSEAVVDFSKFDYSFNSAWKIRNKNGTIFMSGGPYNNVKEAYNESKCLEVGEYSFAIANGWEDTSCCATSNGTYSVTIDGEVVQYGKELDPSSTKTFRVSMSTNSSEPSSLPSHAPSDLPSRLSSAKPSSEPLGSPSCEPSDAPSLEPSVLPSKIETKSPSLFETDYPSVKKALNPTTSPTDSPTESPTSAAVPKPKPAHTPSLPPTEIETRSPSFVESDYPSIQESNLPSWPPTMAPVTTSAPTVAATPALTDAPTASPTSAPAESPTASPTAPPTASTLLSVTTTYKQSYSGFDELNIMNSSQIVSYETSMESTATNLSVLSQIESYDDTMKSHATTSSANMNNVECKVTDQQIESISSTSPTNPSIVWSKKLTIIYDLKVMHDSKEKILLYNEQFIDHMKEQHDQIKESMADVQVNLGDILVISEIISPSFVPSFRPFENPIPSSISTSPTTSTRLNPQTDKPTIAQTLKPTVNIAPPSPTTINKPHNKQKKIEIKKK